MQTSDDGWKQSLTAPKQCQRYKWLAIIGHLGHMTRKAQQKSAMPSKRKWRTGVEHWLYQQSLQLNWRSPFPSNNVVQYHAFLSFYIICSVVVLDLPQACFLPWWFSTFAQHTSRQWGSVPKLCSNFIHDAAISPDSTLALSAGDLVWEWGLSAVQGLDWLPEKSKSRKRVPCTNCPFYSWLSVCKT